jgi:hypothetical protein
MSSLRIWIGECGLFLLNPIDSITMEVGSKLKGHNLEGLELTTWFTLAEPSNQGRENSGRKPAKHFQGVE